MAESEITDENERKSYPIFYNKANQTQAKTKRDIFCC